MKNINKILIFTFILIIGLNFIYATDNTTINQDNNLIEQNNNLAQDTIEEKDNPIQNKEKTIIKENKTLKKEPKTIILNSSTFDTYVTNRTFNEKVSNGDTIDIQGILDGGRFSLNVNKPLNIISSTHDAYIDLDKKSAGFYGSNEANDHDFVISNGGSGSNVSDLTFHNTHIYTTNAQNITITNITADCNQAVGIGRGMISIRDGSRNITIRNSYFETFSNGGHSNVVFAYAHDCLFENNTVKGHGFVGNLIYITTYGSAEDTGETNVTYGNTNITIRNNYIDGTDATDNGICVGVVIEGANHTIVNNTILKTISGMAQVNDYGTNLANNTFADNYCPITYYKLINITNQNYNNYGNLINNTYYLNENVTNQNVVLNLTLAEEIYSEYKFNLIAINTYNYIIKQITLNHTNITINDVYTPQTTFNLLQDATVTNSTIKRLNLHNTKSNITNNIIINQDNSNNNNPTTINIDETNNETIIENNYLLAYNTPTAQSGKNTIKIQNNNGGKIRNNTPHYNNIHILNTTTYNTLFDENNTVKEEINGTIILTQTINQPININKPINITTQKIPNKDKTIYDYDIRGTSPSGLYNFPKIPRTIPYYNNITFTQESNGSNLTNSYTNNINLNTNNINIQNNNINGNITLTNSHNNTITQNNITNNQTYTINLDPTSNNNTIQNNTLNAIYHGDMSISNPKNNTIKNNTPLNDAQITTDINELFYTPTPIKINITNNNKSVTNGYVIIILNGTQIVKENLTNGYLETYIAATKSGNLTLKIYYFAEKDYNNNILTKDITVRKVNTNITLETEGNLTIGETITFKATIQDENQLPLNNETLTFIINNIEHNTTINNGIATFTTKTNDTWINGIYAKLYTTEKYNTTQSNTIKLTKGEANIKATQKITDNNITITAHITDTGNTPLENGYIRFKNGTKTLKNIKITHGIAEYTLPITNGINGTIITLSLTNNNAINNKDENITLTLNPPTITNTKIEPITGKTGQPTTITATVITDDNQPVNQGQVTFTTTDYTETVQVTNGTATITHTFTQTLNNTITATYTPADNTTYYESTNTTTITITKDPENITITLTPINGKTNQETTITATITTQNNTPVNQGSITFTTTDYTETVQVTNGTATITHTFTQTLNDTITATYTPENPEDYNPQTNITTITITEENKELTLKIDTKTFIINQNNTITARIYQGENIQNNISGGKVVFKVNGKSLKDENGKVIYAKVVNGTASIENYTVPQTWNKENITITAVYSGYKEYQSLRSQEEQITLTTPTPTLTITTINTDVQTGSTIKLQAKVTNGNTPITTGKIVFKINGKTLKDTNGKVIYAKVYANGTVSLDYNIGNLKANTYNLTATFIQTGYDKLTANTTINVVKT
ncbi:MAG: Ig-like domain repeat protein [Methanosphaera stadtmanae]|jgi:hypothetical protein|nr:Ig-like domain repeat protein [Methanosphaera stadtmanae]